MVSPHWLAPTLALSLLLLTTACCAQQCPQCQSGLVLQVDTPIDLTSLSIFSPIFPGFLVDLNTPATLLLAPGTYTISQTIQSLGPSLCIVGLGGNRNDTTIQVLGQFPGLRAFQFFQNACLSLQNLVVDAQGINAVAAAESGATVTAEDVDFRNVGVGYALLLQNAAATITNATFSNNLGNLGSAYLCAAFPDVNGNVQRSTTVFREVTFSSNTVEGTGGALFIQAGCTVTFEGNTIFQDNSAFSRENFQGSQSFGGAITVDGSSANEARVIVNGPLCAQRNRAPFGGGFLALSGNAVLEVNSPDVNLFNNPTSDILIASTRVVDSNNIVQATTVSPSIICQGAATTLPDGPYRVTGPLCACIPQFGDPASPRDCNACQAPGVCPVRLAEGFNTTSCSCQAMTAPMCTNRGVGCCGSDGFVKVNGNVCRNATGDCDVAETCDGLSPVCPADVVKPADTPCTPPKKDCTLSIPGLKSEKPVAQKSEKPVAQKSEKPVAQKSEKNEVLFKPGFCNGQSPQCPGLFGFDRSCG